MARSQWQIVWLLALGEPSERVAAVTGYSLTWVRTVARRYNADGAAGIGDRRHANRGGPRLLTPEQEAALDQALEGAAPGGGRWTAAKVADWMSSRSGDRWQRGRAGAICAGSTGGGTARVRSTPKRYGRSGGFSANGLSEQVAQVRAAHPTADVEVWATDEHRIGLKPILRPVWARRGQRPRRPGAAPLPVALFARLCASRLRAQRVAVRLHHQHGGHERGAGGVCPRGGRRSHPSASCSCSIRRGITPVRWCRSLRASIWSSCRRTPPSSNPPNISGSSPTIRWSTSTFPRSPPSKTPLLPAATPCNASPPCSKAPPSFTGGLLP